MLKLQFILHVPTNAILSDEFIEDVGDFNLNVGINMGVYKIIELTPDAAAEYDILGLEDE